MNAPTIRVGGWRTRCGCRPHAGDAARRPQLLVQRILVQRVYEPIVRRQRAVWQLAIVDKDLAIDGDGRIGYQSPSVLSALGRPAEELLGSVLPQVVLGLSAPLA